jgi:hypothetical protein
MIITTVYSSYYGSVLVLYSSPVRVRTVSKEGWKDQRAKLLFTSHKRNRVVTAVQFMYLTMQMTIDHKE